MIFYNWISTIQLCKFCMFLMKLWNLKVWLHSCGGGGRGGESSLSVDRSSVPTVRLRRPFVCVDCFVCIDHLSVSTVCLCRPQKKRVPQQSQGRDKLMWCSRLPRQSQVGDSMKQKSRLHPQFQVEDQMKRRLCFLNDLDTSNAAGKWLTGTCIQKRIPTQSDLDNNNRRIDV